MREADFRRELEGLGKQLSDINAMVMGYGDEMLAGQDRLAGQMVDMQALLKDREKRDLEMMDMINFIKSDPRPPHDMR